MFAPIAGTTAVTGFDVASQAASIAPEAKSTGSPANASDKEAFAALMEPVQGASGVAPVPVQHGPTALSGLEKLANVQKTEMQDNIQSMRDFSAAAPYLSMTESAGFGMELNVKMAITSAHFQVATSVGKNTGKGIDTLMKNQ